MKDVGHGDKEHVSLLVDLGCVAESFTIGVDEDSEDWKHGNEVTDKDMIVLWKIQTNQVSSV